MKDSHISAYLYRDVYGNKYQGSNEHNIVVENSYIQEKYLIHDIYWRDK